ncbi:SpoIIE family protein phosphatase [Deltaproteobacteria bacterium TL4]
MSARGKAKILAVDDRPENILALESLLEEFDLEVIKAYSGAEALKLSYQHDLALILLDVQMPDMDGFETAEILRTIEKTRYVPIIFVTAINHTQEHMFQGYEAGAVDYLFKPIAPYMLKAKVNVFIRLDYQRKQLLAQTQKLEEWNIQLNQEIEKRKAAESKAKKALNQIERQQERIQEELEEARNIQKFFLPRNLPDFPNISLNCTYVAAKDIGGDLYDIVKIGDNHLCLMIADVSGHGIPAALLSSMLSYVFKTSVSQNHSPDHVIQSINNVLYQNIPKDKFATMFYGVYDIRSQLLSYIGAGHPSPYLIRAQSQELISLPPTLSPLGIQHIEGVNPTVNHLPMLPGDKLILYTDALVEVFDAQLQILGEEGLQNFLKRHFQSSSKDLLAELYRFGLEYSKQEKYDDDYTMVIMELHAEIPN